MNLVGALVLALVLSLAGNFYQYKEVMKVNISSGENVQKVVQATTVAQACSAGTTQLVADAASNKAAVVAARAAVAPKITAYNKKAVEILAISAVGSVSEMCTQANQVMDDYIKGAHQ